MEIEEIKSTPINEEFTILDIKNTVSIRTTPAMFDGRNLMPCETLYNLFDGDCSTRTTAPGTDTAVGFIGNKATIATTHEHCLYIRMEGPLTNSCYDWYDEVFENLFGFPEGTIRNEATVIYEKAENLIIWIGFMSKTDILVQYYFKD